MPKQKPLVIVTRKLPDEIETRMMELFHTRLNVDDRPLSTDDLRQAVQDCDVLVPTVTDRIDADLENLALGAGAEQPLPRARGLKGPKQVGRQVPGQRGEHGPGHQASVRARRKALQIAARHIPKKIDVKFLGERLGAERRANKSGAER